MIIIIDKSDINSIREQDVTRNIPLHEIEDVDLTSQNQLTSKNIEACNLLIVTDYKDTLEFRVLKDRFNKDLDTAKCQPMAMLTHYIGGFTIDYMENLGIITE